MSCYVMLCYVMSCYVMLCYVMSCRVVSCYVMLCYVMSCHVMLCYVCVMSNGMLCSVMRFSILFTTNLAPKHTPSYNVTL